MELQTAISYLVALAVPLWLVVELAVHTRKSSSQRQGHRASTRFHTGPASRTSPPPARKLANSRRPA